eukprot:TRINITY_DN147_c0_g2_i1.p1 TRINITY_DN147_c0_g2~~TRINITY_DN147_c0_g2_i1.p1  ORF type:complete len:207 (+),score=21.97 TRINITY_DN147_c0_g2_i1:199-819(+)
MNDGSLPFLQDLCVYDWILPTGTESTGSAIGVESVMILPSVKESSQIKMNPESSTTWILPCHNNQNSERTVSGSENTDLRSPSQHSPQHHLMWNGPNVPDVLSGSTRGKRSHECMVPPFHPDTRKKPRWNASNSTWRPGTMIYPGTMMQQNEMVMHQQTPNFGRMQWSEDQAGEQADASDEIATGGHDHLLLLNFALQAECSQVGA